MLSCCAHPLILNSRAGIQKTPFSYSFSLGKQLKTACHSVSFKGKTLCIGIKTNRGLGKQPEDSKEENQGQRDPILLFTSVSTIELKTKHIQSPAKFAPPNIRLCFLLTLPFDFFHQTQVSISYNLGRRCDFQSSPNVYVIHQDGIYTHCVCVFIS